MRLVRGGHYARFSIIGVITVAVMLLLTVMIVPSLIQQDGAEAAIPGQPPNKLECDGDDVLVDWVADVNYRVYQGDTPPAGWESNTVCNTVTLPGGCSSSYTGPLTLWVGWNDGTFHSTSITCPQGSSGGGGTTEEDGHEAFDPLDPDPNAVRAWGGYDTTFSSNLIVYVAPYGYPYYHHSGQIIGVMDFNAVGIPEAICLIGSITGGNETEVWRVDSYYMGGDQVQANLYENGALTQEAWFDVPGIGARAGEVPCQVAPPAPGDAGTGDGTGGTAVVANPSPAGTVEVVCRQNLRQASSVDTPVLTVMEPGMTLSVWGRSNDNSWLEVTTPDGIQGWSYNGRCLNAGAIQIQEAPVEVVFANQPTAGGETQAPAAPQTAAVISPDGPIVGIICRQNMRTGPGTSFAVGQVLTAGMTANVVGRSGDASWLQISDGSYAGWVYRGQCVMPQQGDVTAAPVTATFGG